MKTQAIALGSIAGALLAPGAQAADLPAKAYYKAAPVQVSWAGFYIGGHLGGASTEAKLYDDDYGTTKFVGGGQIGFNFQAGDFVYGIEVDGSALIGNKGDVDNGYGTGFSWLATARGRFGMTFGTAGDWLVYGTAGAAFTKAKLYSGGNVVESESITGWVVGGGVEHMLDRNWIIGAEVLFADFGTHDMGKSVPFNHSALVGRVKLNYKF